MKRRLIVLLLIPLFVFFFALLQILLQTPIFAIAALGDDVVGFLGIQKAQVKSIEETIGEGSIEDIRKELGNDFRYALDCSNVPPAERRPGKNCIEGLLHSGASWSPIPESKQWLVPIWKKAASKYGVEWELLAAVNGARTFFGERNCQTEFGQGFYRFEKEARKYFLDAGNSAKEDLGNFCVKSEPPVAISGFKNIEKAKYSSGGDPYDAVDATFSKANQMQKLGAEESWDYTGSPADYCMAPGSDGPLWYVPERPVLFGEGAALGWNKNLEIPRRAVLLAAKYRSNKGKYKPRRDTPDRNRSPMKKEDIIYLLEVAWKAFGMRGEDLRMRVSKNYSQVGRESGGRPYILQGYIGDVNDTNPAGGLFQFIESTFAHWKVDGFDDRFNPLDNILAAVNAQVNGPYYILDGSSGWSPPFSENPYAKGGKSKIVDSASVSSGKVEEKPYTGKAQTDATSRAIAVEGSPCYVAVVHDWYQAIKENPPMQGTYLPGPNGTRKIQGGGKLIPCPKSIPQDTGNACYIDSRIKENVLWIHKKFGIYIQDAYSGPLPGGGAAGCYASGYQCHSTNGEHPLGLALDIGPIPGEDWSQIDKLARWAESSQDDPKPPFRWVGYDGDANHGSGHHLHLSWDHELPATPYKVVPGWVLVFGKDGEGLLRKPLKEEVIDPDSEKREKPDLRARVSWFTGSMTASGMNANKRAGVALNLRPGTEAGWDNERTNKWMIAAREGNPYYARIVIRGRKITVPIIDKGPHESTNRGIDLTLRAVKRMGWEGPDFPTDAFGKVYLLGQKK